jgi:phosphatidylserine/phosphatidylglycerophosphate/cardiolipin synthase-like enzyme
MSDDSVAPLPLGQGATAMVRCQLMKGSIQVRDPGAMSPLHSFALLAIARHDDLREVLNAFGVGRRVMQDVLVDLFYAGLVFLDVHKGRVVLSPEVADALPNGRLSETLLRVKPLEIEVTWVQEMLSGGVMIYPLISRFLDRPAATDGLRSLVDQPFPITPLENLSVRTLAKSALPILRERAPPADSVLDRVERVTDRRLLGSRTFYVPLRFVKRAGDQSPIAVPDVIGVPQIVVDAWTVALNPRDDPVGLSLNATRDIEDELPPHPGILSESWRASLKVLREAVGSPQGTEAAIDETDRALETLQLIASRMDNLVNATETRVGIGGVAQEHFGRLVTTIDHARVSLVIGSAFASEDSVLSLAKRVAPATRRGVKVLFICGLPRSSGPATSLDRFLDLQGKLNRIAPPQDGDEIPPVTFVPSALPFHSKYVVADAHEAWVSSLNWLSVPPDARQWEASVVGVGTPVATDILSFVAPYLPRGHPWRKLLEDVTSLGTAEPAASKDDLSSRRKIVDGVATAWKARLAPPNRQAAKQMTSGLENALIPAGRVGDELGDARTAAVISDSEHRRLLTRAIGSARKEITIVSDGLSVEGAGSVLSALLREAVDRCVKITIRWGRAGKDAEDTSLASKRAEELKSELGESLDINLAPAGVHGKVAVIDESFSIVSSFNFLSFGGVPGRERALSGELGLAVSDPEVSRVLRDSLRLHESQ